MRLKRKWKSDWEGRPLRAGDRVRVCAIPDLTGMSDQGVKESLPAFRHALRKPLLIDRFDQFGNACLSFSIPFGKHRGMHAIYVEVALLRRLGAATARQPSTHITHRSARSHVERAPN